MAKKENITPEERLLKIIEKPEEQKKHAEKFNRRKKTEDTLRNVASAFNPANWKQPGLEFSLQTANKVLIIAAVAVTLLLVILFFKDRADINSRFEDIMQVSAEEQEAQAGKELPEYNIAVAVRESKQQNMFSLTQKKPRPKARPQEKNISDLQLVGLLWSDNPQVMVEDKKENKTYMLSEGDTIARWKVKDIQRDKVILYDEAGEWELR